MTINYPLTQLGGAAVFSQYSPEPLLALAGQRYLQSSPNLLLPRPLLAPGDLVTKIVVEDLPPSSSQDFDAPGWPQLSIDLLPTSCTSASQSSDAEQKRLVITTSNC